MDTHYIDNIRNKKKFNDMLSYLLIDFQMQTTLSEKVYPEYRKTRKSRKTHPNIEYWFPDLKKNCEFKKDVCMSKPIFRKGESKAYQTKTNGYRLKIKDFIEKFTQFKFSDRTKFILECMFYPASIRKLVFTDKRLNFFGGDSEKVLGDWLISFLIDYIYPNILYTQDVLYSHDRATSRHYFDKYIYNNKTPEEVSRFVWIKMFNPDLHYSSYLSKFIDEEFIFDICKGFPEDNQKLSNLKRLKDKIDEELGWKYFHRKEVKQELESHSKKKIKSLKLIGAWAIAVKGTWDKETLREIDKEIKILKELYDKFEKEHDILKNKIGEESYYITQEDFSPKDISATGYYGKEKREAFLKGFENLNQLPEIKQI